MRSSASSFLSPSHDRPVERTKSQFPSFIVINLAFLKSYSARKKAGSMKHLESVETAQPHGHTGYCNTWHENHVHTAESFGCDVWMIKCSCKSSLCGSMKSSGAVTNDYYHYRSVSYFFSINKLDRSIKLWKMLITAP